MNTSRFKKTICVLASIIVMTGTLSAQSLLNGMDRMIEIRWNFAEVIYKGLLTYYNDGQAVLTVQYYAYPYGTVTVVENAVVQNQYDYYGNCTTYIYCSNPTTYPELPPYSYAADNFIIYPNGAMYTQDAFGNWSTLITANIVPCSSWRYKLRQYGYDE